MASLDELTNKIYLDGVEKGKAQADELVSAAQTKASEIVSAAQKEAATIISKAQKQSAEISTNCKSELQLYTNQCMSALKTAITDLICGTIVSDSVKVATTDAKFMQEIISKLAQSMVKDGSITIEAKDADALKKYFAGNAKQLLDKGVEIKTVKDLKTSFSIISKNGGYKLSFGEAEFVALFKEFLRPQLIDLLFTPVK